MSDDFKRPSTMGSQMAVARALFAAPSLVDPADMDAIEIYLRQAETEIGKEYGASDFKADRLSKAQRHVRGIDISKRQYNKRFRLTSRMEAKVLRLMAADVAAWHRASGGDLHADTGPWCDLPLPWEVLRGEPCSRSRVEAVCGKWEVDPIKGGWIAPPPERKVAAFAPTPELVHGVTVASPHLAALLRKAGVFSGKVLSWPVTNI